MTRKTVPCVGHEIFANCLTSFLWPRKATVGRRLGRIIRLMVISKIQLVVYHQCCVLIG